MPGLKNRIERLERAFPPEPELSQDDHDALTIYRHIWLKPDMAPNVEDLGVTAIYARGKKLAGQANEHREERHKVPTESRAASMFAFLFGRLPEPGDMMRFSYLEYIPVLTRHVHKQFIDSWTRQLPDLPCPLRFDGDRLQKRTRPITKGHEKGLATWVDYGDYAHSSPERVWLKIHREAGLDDNAPSISGVFFLDAVRCRPATEQELKQDQTAPPTGGLLGIVVKALNRLREEGVVA